MYDFVFKSFLLGFRILPMILLEIIMCGLFIGGVFLALGSQPMLLAIIMMFVTGPFIAFFSASMIRSGLLELDLCDALETKGLVWRTYKFYWFTALIGFLSLVLAGLIWVAIMAVFFSDIDIRAVLASNIRSLTYGGADYLRSGSGMIGPFLILIGCSVISFAILSICFIVPIAKFAASFDGVTKDDILTGFGTNFLHILLTFIAGGTILSFYSLIVGIVLSVSASLGLPDIYNTPILILTIIFGSLLPIGYLISLNAAVSAHALQSFKNSTSDREKSTLTTMTYAAPSDEIDIAEMRKLRQMRNNSLT